MQLVKLREFGVTGAFCAALVAAGCSDGSAERSAETSNVEVREAIRQIKAAASNGWQTEVKVGGVAIVPGEPGKAVCGMVMDPGAGAVERRFFFDPKTQIVRTDPGHPGKMIADTAKMAEDACRNFSRVGAGSASICEQADNFRAQAVEQGEFDRRFKHLCLMVAPPA